MNIYIKDINIITFFIYYYIYVYKNKIIIIKLKNKLL